MAASYEGEENVKKMVCGLTVYSSRGGKEGIARKKKKPLKSRKGTHRVIQRKERRKRGAGNDFRKGRSVRVEAETTIKSEKKKMIYRRKT